MNDAVQVLQSVLDNPVTGIPWSSNAVKAMKPTLLKEGHRTYPVIVFIGDPGSGKTTIAENLILYGEEDMDNPDDRHFFITTDYTESKMKKICKKRRDDILIIDDFADFKGYNARSKVKDYLDGIVRPSFAGESAMLVLTVETPVIKMITDSLKSRVIIINVNKWKEMPDSEQILIGLRRNRNTLCELMDEFREWSSEKSFDVFNRKLSFRKRKKEWADET